MINKSFCLVLISSMLLLLFGCNNDNLVSPLYKNGFSQCYTIEEQTLLVDQKTQIGKVLLTNDTANIYLSFQTDEGWFLDDTHLFVGDCNKVPKNQKGTIMTGRFPYSSSHQGVSAFSYTVPFDKKSSDCLCVVAFASSVKVDTKGNVLAQKTAFNPTKSVYCVQTCKDKNPDIKY